MKTFLHLHCRQVVDAIVTTMMIITVMAIMQIDIVSAIVLIRTQTNYQKLDGFHALSNFAMVRPLR